MRKRPDLAARNIANATHGLSHSPTYVSWRAMLQRASKAHRGKPKDRANYIERGICMCNRWLYFENFIFDMGERPKDTEIERIDNNCGYEPGNCRWATRREQAQNRRSTRTISCFGEALPLVEWSRRTGIGRVLISHRLRAGWPPEEVLTVKPSRSANSRWRRNGAKEERTS